MRTFGHSILPLSSATFKRQLKCHLFRFAFAVVYSHPVPAPQIQIRFTILELCKFLCMYSVFFFFLLYGAPCGLTHLQSPHNHPTTHIYITKPPRSTRSSSLVTLARPPTSSSLRITDRSFRYVSPCLYNPLPSSLRQPHSSLSVSYLPFPHLQCIRL